MNILKKENMILTIQITSQCNLNCFGCSHFSPIAEPYFISLDVFEEQLKIIKNSDIEFKDIVLFGGEPFLHPEIDKIIMIANKYFPKVSLLTNGRLIKNLSKQQLLNIKNSELNLMLTDYYTEDYDNMEHRKILDEYEIKYDQNQIRTIFYNYRIDYSGQQDKKNKYLKCINLNDSAKMFTLKDFKLYFCYFAYGVDISNKIDKKEIDFLDIRDNFNLEKLNMFANKEKNICKYCYSLKDSHYMWQKFDFSDLNSYNFSLKEYFLYDYNRYLQYSNNKYAFLESYYQSIDHPDKIDNEINTSYYEKRFITSIKDIGIIFDKESIQEIKNILNYIFTSITDLENYMFYFLLNGRDVFEEEIIYDLLQSKNISYFILKTNNKESIGQCKNHILDNSYGKYIYFIENNKDILIYKNFLNLLNKTIYYDNFIIKQNKLKFINSSYNEDYLFIIIYNQYTTNKIPLIKLKDDNIFLKILTILYSLTLDREYLTVDKFIKYLDFDLVKKINFLNIQEYFYLLNFYIWSIIQYFDITNQKIELYINYFQKNIFLKTIYSQIIKNNFYLQNKYIKNKEELDLIILNYLLKKFNNEEILNLYIKGS